MTSKDWVSAEKQDKNSDQIDVPQLRFPGFNDEWKTYKLGDFLSFYSTNSFSRFKLNYKSGTVKNIHYGDIHTNYPPILNCNSNKIPYINNNIDLSKFESASYLKDGDLIIADASEDYDDIGKAIEVVNVGDKKILSGLHTILARDENNRTVNGFKSYLFLSESIRHNLKVIANGISVLGISKTNLSKIEVKIPSLSEQQKIVELFNLIQEKIILMERKHKLIKKYKNGLMHEIFTQNIKFSNNELCLFKLGEIVELMRNGSNELQVNFKTEFPVTRIETISKGNINFDKVGFVETIDKSYQLKKGDILLSNINSLKYIGNCVYFDTDKILYHGMNLMLIRFKENFNKKFLYYYIKYHKKWFQRMACQAVNQASINQTSLKKFPFVIPKLKTDQDKIANFLSKIDNKINSVEQQLEKIKEFKKYLLQQMFV